jgi:hypothetical protein
VWSLWVTNRRLTLKFFYKSFILLHKILSLPPIHVVNYDVINIAYNRFLLIHCVNTCIAITLLYLQNCSDWYKYDRSNFWNVSCDCYFTLREILLLVKLKVLYLPIYIKLKSLDTVIPYKLRTITHLLHFRSKTLNHEKINRSKTNNFSIL